MLVSLFIFTIQAQSKWMFLDIPFIFLTKKLIVFDFFSKILFMQPYFNNNKNPNTQKTLNEYFQGFNILNARLNIWRFKYQNIWTHIYYWKNRFFLKILWKSTVCNKKLNVSIYIVENIKIYSEIQIYSKCSLKNKYIHIYIQTKERCHAKFLEGHNLWTRPLIGPISQTKVQP